MTSPRPTPKFFLEEQTFSSKKERIGSPRSCPRPRSPIKSLPPISRIFQRPASVQKAQGISFKSPDTSLTSKHYREDAKSSYFVQCFEVHGKLGTGSFGEVFKVKSREDGQFYAVKKARERFRGEADRLHKLEEVRKHEELPKHPNCTHFVKAWQENGFLYIQTELCQYSLANYSELNHDIPESIVWKYLVDLLLALKHLHAHELIHLDIKPENIFISQDDVCKLGDFGLVLDLKKGSTSEALEGDPKYLAPELMQGKFTKAADVFSLGITILELACDLDLPRGGDSWHKLRTGKTPDQFLKSLSINLKEVIHLMMEPNFKSRPTVDQLLQHCAISKMTRWRCMEIRVKTAGQMSLFCLLWLCMLLRTLISPLCWLTRRIGPWNSEPDLLLGTPTHPSQRTATTPCAWENSFSDDELGDEEDLRRYSSMATPLSESSTSGDSHNNSSTLSPSTNSSRKRLKGGKSVTSFKGIGSTIREWPSSVQNSIRTSLLSRSVHSMAASDLPSSSTPLALSNSKSISKKILNGDMDPNKGVIGPRNLMMIFNNDDSTDEEI